MQYWKIFGGGQENSPNQNPLADHGILVDASSEWGIRLQVGDQYKAWHWKPQVLGYGGRDIGGAESIGIKFAIWWLVAKGVCSQRVKISADNQGANGAFDWGHGCNRWTNEAIQWGWEVSDTADLDIWVQYIMSAANPADPVSRGNVGGLSKLPEAFEIPRDVVPFLYKV
jgi:hypothetical protein